MPYIRQGIRERLNSGEWPPISPGELNYLITKLVLQYLKKEGTPISYSQYNEVLGVLDAVGKELYRREIAPYEDQKIIENGDVYP